MTVTTLEIMRADKQLWREYLSNRTKENKAKIESYEKLEWILSTTKSEFENQAYITELREYVLNLIDKLCFGTVATDHNYNRIREEAKGKVEYLRTFLLRKETKEEKECSKH